MSTLKYTYIIIMNVFVQSLFNKIRMSFFFGECSQPIYAALAKQNIFLETRVRKENFHKHAENRSAYRLALEQTWWVYVSQFGSSEVFKPNFEHYAFVFHILLDKGIKITFHIYGWMYHQDSKVYRKYSISKLNLF